MVWRSGGRGRRAKRRTGEGQASRRGGRGVLGGGEGDESGGGEPARDLSVELGLGPPPASGSEGTSPRPSTYPLNITLSLDPILIPDYI